MPRHVNVRDQPRGRRVLDLNAVSAVVGIQAMRPKAPSAGARSAAHRDEIEPAESFSDPVEHLPPPAPGGSVAQECLVGPSALVHGKEGEVTDTVTRDVGHR